MGKEPVFSIYELGSMREPRRLIFESKGVYVSEYQARAIVRVYESDGKLARDEYGLKEVSPWALGYSPTGKVWFTGITAKEKCVGRLDPSTKEVLLGVAVPCPAAPIRTAFSWSDEII